MGKKLPRIGLIALALGFAAVVPARGDNPALSMLDGLEAGSWEIRMRAPGNPRERICLANGRQLIQLRHPDAQCEQLILQDTPTEVVVQYTCRGKGYGRTQLRRETSRLVQIDGQGIAQGLPFEFSGEARRTGNCAGAGARGGARGIATARTNS